MDSIPQELKNSQCAVNWNVTAVRQPVNIVRLKERLKEKLEEKDVGQTWKALNILLFLAYEHLVSQDGVCKLSYLRHSEEIIKVDLWVRKHYKAAQHMLYSLWAHIYLKMGNRKSASDVITKITPYNELSTEDQAFIFAMKAYFFMIYGPSGNEEASKTLTEVLVLESSEPEWYYLKGKCLSRIRRLHYRSKPTPEEVAFFKKAVEMNDECARYLIHLARSKADMASDLRHSRTSVEDFKVLEAIETDVESILRKAVELSVDSPHLMCHIAKSFMKLSHYFRIRNLKLTQFCVMKAVEVSPSDAMVNHTVGLYHLTCGQTEEAVFFLTEASNMGVHGASFDLCRLKWTECRGYNPVPDLMEIVNVNCIDEFAASEAHCLLATYYFFVKNDLLATVKHWKQWHHSRDKTEYSISSCFLGQESVDFNSVLFDEVRLELNSARYQNPEHKSELREALAIIRENRPELASNEPRRQRQDLIDKAQMISRLGRCFPDSLDFLYKEQRAKRKGEPFGLEEITKKNGKKMCVSSKYNAFFRDRQETEGDAPEEKTRSQSESRILEPRRNRQKPFWRPKPKRHASAENLGEKSSKSVGSGRLTSTFESDQLKIKAASVDTLLVLKSYESCHRRKNDRSSFGARRTESQESLASNALSREWRSIDIGSRSSSSEVLWRNLSRDKESFRASSPGASGADPSLSRSRNPSCSDAGLPRSWRRDENSCPEQENLKSSYFQSFSTNDASRSTSLSSSITDRHSSKSAFNCGPSSRSSMGREDDPSSSFFSRNDRGQGDRFGPSSRSSMSREEGSSSFSRNYRDQDDRFGPSSRSSVSRESMSSSPSFSRNGRDRGEWFGPSSRSSMGRKEGSSSFSWTDRGQGDMFRPPTRPLSGNKGNPLACSSLQSSRGSGQGNFLSRGTGNYVPRGGSFSRGGERDERGLSDSLRDFENSFKRLNL